MCVAFITLRRTQDNDGYLSMPFMLDNVDSYVSMQELYTAVKKPENLLDKWWLAQDTFASGANTEWRLERAAEDLAISQ